MFVRVILFGQGIIFLNFTVSDIYSQNLWWSIVNPSFFMEYFIFRISKIIPVCHMQQFINLIILICYFKKKLQT